MDWGRRVCLLSIGLNDPVTAVFWFMRVDIKVRLLWVVAKMVVMRITFNGGDISTAIAIIVRVWSPPNLALLSSSGRPVVLVGEAMWLVTSVACPLLLLMWKHPPTLVRKVAVAAPAAHVVMRVVATSLGANLGADRRGSLIGCPRVRGGLLDRPQSTFPHSVWRSVAPGSFSTIIFLQCLFLPQGGC